MWNYKTLVIALWVVFCSSKLFQKQYFFSVAHGLVSEMRLIYISGSEKFEEGKKESRSKKWMGRRKARAGISHPTDCARYEGVEKRSVQDFNWYWKRLAFVKKIERMWSKHRVSWTSSVLQPKCEDYQRCRSTVDFALLPWILVNNFFARSVG